MIKWSAAGEDYEKWWSSQWEPHSIATFWHRNKHEHVAEVSKYNLVWPLIKHQSLQGNLITLSLEWSGKVGGIVCVK